MEINYTKRDLESHDALGLVIKDDNNRFLCLYHNKFLFWTIPLGKAEEGQSPEDAVVNEAKEELSIHVKRLKKIFQDTITYKRKGKYIVAFFFLYEINEYEGRVTNAEPEKHADMRYMTLDELRTLPNTSDATKMLLRYYETIAKLENR